MTNRRQIALDGLFISPKRNSLLRPDGTFADFKESALGALAPPYANWTAEAWHTLGEMWDGRPITPRSWFTLPALRCLTASSPAYAQQLKGFPGLRPWNSFLIGTAIARMLGDAGPRTAIVVAPFEPNPERWAGLPWRFADTGRPVPLGGPDLDGVTWRLRTLRDFLLSYVQHPISEMLAPDGSRCGPYTRGLLRRHAIRDGEAYIVLKEAAVYSDSPRDAFSVPPPEIAVQPTAAEPASGAWERSTKPALVIIGPTAVARKMGLAARTGRAWVAGERRPDNTHQVAQEIVAVAHEAGLSLPIDEQLRAEEICADLPGRVALVQLFAAIMTVLLAARLGGVRPLARALAGDGKLDLDPAIRRWQALGRGKLRQIGQLNRIIARIALFSRGAVPKIRRRIAVESGPACDRQTVLMHISLLYRAEELAVISAEETLVLTAALTMMLILNALAGWSCSAVRPRNS